MTPQETFNALIQGKKVKLKDDVFKGFLDEFENYQAKPDNDFLINSIEESAVSLHNYNTQEVYYDIDFDCITLSGEKNKTEENIYLNRLKEQYKQVKEKISKDDFYLNGYEQAKKYYDAMRLFCLDTQLISFNEIELMEFEVNQSFS